MSRPLFDIPPDPEEQLPALNGSAAQVAWAEKVRVGKLAGVRSAIREMQELIARYEQAGKTEPAETHRARLLLWIDRAEVMKIWSSAAYWLDHRENSVVDLLNDAPANPGSEGYFRVGNAGSVENWT